MNCQCGQLATRQLGALDYCDPCREAILRPIRKRVAERDGVGFGEQIGRLRPPEWVETLGSRFAKGAACVVVEIIPRETS